ncbi:MAG: deoxyuridine 5'-triphosphate nucleotidohydrolase [Sulfolobales archaeon]|nr:deoxyuridine 5'-triphosphate nucleotidohydrolase [Sulfolobales archaeon]MDW7969179.1 deoxyuridine 5'-triphosphate nucleotidohydrolase [Sulfolobales archaeon]
MKLIIPPQHLLNLGYPADSLDCSGVKLTLDEVFMVGSDGTIDVDDKTIPSYLKVNTDKESFYKLLKGYYIVRYAEYVRIPEDSIALSIPRSSIIRSGASLFTAVWDPGYEGRGYGLLVIYNEYGIKIRRGAQIAQLIFIKMVERSSKQYRGSYFGER